mgnify:CR=1 FL=1
MELLKKSRAFLLLFVTFFFWGSVYVGGKLISDDVPAPLLGCLRCFVASFPLMLMRRKHFGVKIDRADWKYFAGVGVMGYFLTIFLIQLGISLTGASMASLVNSVTPVGVTIFAALHLKEKITPTKVLCLVLALVGGCWRTASSPPRWIPWPIRLYCSTSAICSAMPTPCRKSRPTTRPT